MDFPKKQAQRLMPLYLLEYSEKLFENHPDPEAPWGGGGSDYTAGYGIDITNSEISVDTDVIATKSDIASMVTTSMLEDALDDYALKTDIPENVSDLNNDAGYITSNALGSYVTSNDLSSALSNYALSSTVTGIASQVTTLESLVSNHTTQINSINSNITDLQTLTSTHTSQISGINSSVTSLESLVNTNTSNISTIQNSISSISSSITTLEGLTSTHTSQISALQTSVSNCVTLSQLSTTLSDYTPTSGLASVATTGSYNDLTDKPNIVNPHTLANGDLVFQATGTWYPAYRWFDDAAITSASSSFVDIITNFEADLILPEEFTQGSGVLYAKRMVDGVQVDEHEFRYVYALYSSEGEPGYIWFIYNDSLDTITSVTKQLFDAIDYQQLTNILSSYVTSSSLTSTLSNYAQTSTLASVATTGNYNDLSNKPTIPDAVSGTNDGTNWTTLTIGNSTYDIPQGGSAPGLIGEVLFSSASGTEGDITLSNSLANYSYIDIEYFNTENVYNTTRIYSPNGKLIGLETIFDNPPSSRHYMISIVYSLSGTSMTVQTTSLQTRLTNNAAVVISTGAIKVSKVIGYKANSSALTTEQWTFTLQDGTTITKNIVTA